MVSPKNDYCGHRAVLNAYLGCRPETAYQGVLQHGWNDGPVDERRRVPGLNRAFVWGERHRLPTDKYIPIGAPFLYHSDVERVRSASPDVSRLLAFPYHGHGVDLDEVHVAYARFLSESDATSITVCLHPLEFSSPIRRTYEVAGFEVTSNGRRSAPDFLDRFLALMAAHGGVTANRASTACFYAAFLGRHLTVRGPLARSADNRMASVAYRDQVARHDREFGYLADGVDGTEAIALGERELGAPFKRSREELASLLGTDRVRQGVLRTVRRLNHMKNSLRPAPRPSVHALGRAGESVASLHVTR